MLNKKRELNDFLPDYIRKISEDSNPVFRTCEVLIRIDNMFKEDNTTPLNYNEKIMILKHLRKGLYHSLSDTFRISPSQGDPNRSVLELINDRIEEYSFKQSISPKFPKIYERKSWWR